VRSRSISRHGRDWTFVGPADLSRIFKQPQFAHQVCVVLTRAGDAEPGNREGRFASDSSLCSE
jgi:hypothetical protein